MENQRKYIQYYDQNGNPTYKGFVVKSGGISTHYSEISKAEYDRLSAMTYAEVSAEIKSKLSDSIIYGYGYYGHSLIQENGMFFLGKEIGNSCD